MRKKNSKTMYDPSASHIILRMPDERDKTVFDMLNLFCVCVWGGGSTFRFCIMVTFLFKTPKKSVASQCPSQGRFSKYSWYRTHPAGMSQFRSQHRDTGLRRVPENVAHWFCFSPRQRLKSGWCCRGWAGSRNELLLYLIFHLIKGINARG